MKSTYAQLQDLLTIAIDTGNRDYADEVYAAALAAKDLTEAEQAELIRDYNSAVEAGEI
jgi:hypothetical protein